MISGATKRSLGLGGDDDWVYEDGEWKLKWASEEYKRIHRDKMLRIKRAALAYLNKYRSLWKDPDVQEDWDLMNAWASSSPLLDANSLQALAALDRLMSKTGDRSLESSWDLIGQWEMGEFQRVQSESRSRSEGGPPQGGGISLDVVSHVPDLVGTGTWLGQRQSEGGVFGLGGMKRTESVVAEHNANPRWSSTPLNVVSAGPPSGSLSPGRVYAKKVVSQSPGALSPIPNAGVVNITVYHAWEDIGPVGSDHHGWTLDETGKIVATTTALFAPSDERDPDSDATFMFGGQKLTLKRMAFYLMLIAAGLGGIYVIDKAIPR